MNQHRHRERARTLLEVLIRARGFTVGEFVTHFEQVARELGERGTLSERHLKRLTAGTTPSGHPIGAPRPATARVLEHIFDAHIDELLAPPAEHSGDDVEELRHRINAATRIDGEIVRLMREQLEILRRLDQRLGAPSSHHEVVANAGRVHELLSYSIQANVRQPLAALAAEFHTLAGWQALDLGHPHQAWAFYETAKAAAHEHSDLGYHAHAVAEQTNILLDLGHTSTAVQLAEAARHEGTHVELRVRAWLEAAHGEALAAANQTDASLRAFDHARDYLDTAASTDCLASITLDTSSLERWRGNALTRLHHAEAGSTLMSILDKTAPKQTRAVTSATVDLVHALHHKNYADDARKHLESAMELADQIGSARHQRRLRKIASELPD